MSPSLASSATKAGSFFSSPVWKRVFSRQQDVAVLHARRRAFAAASPMQSSAKATGSDDRASAAATGCSDSWAIAALGPAEMREQDDLAALVGDLADGRHDALDARGVGHAAVFHRHVEIDAQQHALALDVDVVEGAECFRHRSISSGHSDNVIPGRCEASNPESRNSPVRNCAPGLVLRTIPE